MWDTVGTNSILVILQNIIKCVIYLVIAARLERATYCLEGMFPLNIEINISNRNIKAICISVMLSLVNKCLVLSKGILLLIEVPGTQLGQIKKLCIESLRSHEFILSHFSFNQNKFNQNVFCGGNYYYGKDSHREA